MKNVILLCNNLRALKIVLRQNGGTVEESFCKPSTLETMVVVQK